MYDSYGDGWNGSGALRIVVNGTQLATGIKVSTTAASNNPSGQRSTNTYTFNVAAGAAVQVYWVAGSYQDENSFIMYYTDAPPSPAFTASNNSSWNGSNALVYKLRGTVNSISDGSLLGSFTTSWFAASTVYTATISLTAKAGYTLQGVEANFFTIVGATSVSNSANSGVITVVFPQTAATIINIAAIQGVTAPATGGTPSTTITETAQYTGTVTWNGTPSTFAASTQYTATITLTAKSGYTLQGVAANFFTVAGATSVSNSANSGVITAVFPATVPENQTPVIGDFNISGTGTFTYNGSSRTVTITPKVGSSQGAITVYYNGSMTAPSAVGTYTVTFNVAASTGFNAVTGLSAGTLIINAATPVASDFNISGTGIFTYNASPMTVTITPKTGSSQGAITVYYNGATTAPSAVGTYTVTFNVATSTGFNAVTGLSAGTITINTAIFTITFNSNGGSTVNSQTVEYGNTVNRPTDPTKDRYTFVNWYSNSNLTTVYNFNTTVTSNITLYAKWLYTGGTPIVDVWDIEPYLNTQTGGTSINDPVSLPVSLQLSDSAWTAILTRINTIQKYISLDLSLCTRSSSSTAGGLRSDGTFTPFYSGSNNMSLPGRNLIVSLILPNTAESVIAENYNNLPKPFFPNLKTVSGSNITNIGYMAFSNCTNLTSVNFPLATSIGYGAFYGCTSLINVNFPNVINIGDDVFSDCTNLISVDFPSVTSIGIAFYRCINLISVDFPNLTTISGSTATTTSAGAFSGCTNLTSVNFPKVTSIGRNAFYGCSNLASVTLARANNIGTDAFSGCTAIKEIMLTTALSTSGISDIHIDAKKTLQSVSCPLVTSIGNSAFSGCTNLTSVSFPEATVIGSSAFINCTNLTSVSFPEATVIGSSAFSGCTKLTSANFPKVTNIGSLAFATGTSKTGPTITLGASAPILGVSICGGDHGGSIDGLNYFTKSIIIKVPNGATGYGTIPATYSGTSSTFNWGNAFRGKGWDGSSYGSDPVNSNITLTIQYQ